MENSTDKRTFSPSDIECIQDRQIIPCITICDMREIDPDRCVVEILDGGRSAIITSDGQHVASYGPGQWRFAPKPNPMALSRRNALERRIQSDLTGV